jgi:hypothetical protein
MAFPGLHLHPFPPVSSLTGDRGSVVTSVSHLPLTLSHFWPMPGPVFLRTSLSGVPEVLETKPISPAMPTPLPVGLTAQHPQ